MPLSPGDAPVESERGEEPLLAELLRPAGIGPNDWQQMAKDSTTKTTSSFLRRCGTFFTSDTWKGSAHATESDHTQSQKLCRNYLYVIDAMPQSVPWIVIAVARHFLVADSRDEAATMIMEAITERFGEIIAMDRFHHGDVTLARSLAV